MIDFNIKKLQNLTKELSILYVEDEEKLRDQYTNFFTKIFKRVDTACNGEDGLFKYRDFHEQESKYYDLIISDIMMPKMNGIEMCKNILEENEHQQILIVSAYNDSNKLQSLMELGIHYFIHKPMPLDNMIKVINKICSYIKDQKEHYDNINEMNQNLNRLEKDFKQAVKEKKNFQEDVFGLYSLLENYAITSLTDKDGRILDVNREFEKISGYKKNEIVGEFFDKIRDEDISKKIWESMKKGDICKCEMYSTKKDEEGHFWTDLIVIPMIRNEKIYGYKFIEEDFSEQKRITNLLQDIIHKEEDYLIQYKS
ncbi:MAG: response regulator [Arcobacteraceae bacterium]|nr:response regulator [Arcobacteraceae bacterium]